MSNKYTNLSKNTLLFTLNSFGAKIISFLLVPLYTAVLSSDDYGVVDLVVSAVSLLIPVLTLNVQDAVLRFSLEKDEQKEDVISIGIRQDLIGAGILAVALFLLAQFNILRLDPKYIYFLFAYYLLNGFYNSFSMYLKANDKINVLVVSSLINTLISCILNIVLLLWAKMGINGYLIANISGVLLANIIMFFFGGIIKDCRWKNNKGLAKKMLLYSAPLIFNSVAWWINNASDKYILALFCGVAANGIFAVAYKIPTILSTLQSVFYNAWSISAIKEFDEEDSDGFIGNIYTLYSCISIIGCSFVLLLNIPLAHFLYTNEYFSAWKYVPFLLLGTVFNGLALFEGCLFTAVKKTKEVSYTTIMGAVVNFVANILLIKFIGATGVSIATMMGYFTTWLVRTIQVQKIVRMKVNWWKEIAAIIVLSAQTIFAQYRGFEWLQIILLAVLVILNYRDIKKMLGKAYTFFAKR